MRLRALTTSFAALLAAASLVTGCALDRSTSPSGDAPRAPSAPSSTLLGLGQTTTVTPLLRTPPLATNQTATATIGALGGTISLPGAGLTVVVPPLAVRTATK